MSSILPRRILIFGATSAIASETVLIFSREKAKMFLVGRDEAKLRALTQEALKEGASEVFYRLADICRFDSHQDIIDAAISYLGKIDLVLIAHGLLESVRDDIDYTYAKKVLDVNFLSVVSLLIPLASYFESQKQGQIAVISSIAGDRGKQRNQMYATSKAALNVFLQGMRNRLYTSGVNVITIKPGNVDSPMTAHLPKNFLWVKPRTIARGIHKAIIQKKDRVYLPAFWWWIMMVVKLIPEFIFKRLNL